MIEQQCFTCECWLPIADFTFKASSNSYEGSCKPCRAAQSRAYRQTPEYAEAQRRRKRKAKSNTIQASAPAVLATV